MPTTRSKDGTTIAYTRAGGGPALILVDGALCSRALGPMPEMAKLLASRFTVFTYDRRGRGDSGDTTPYAIAREIEDINALIDVAGGKAFVYGVSSGAALALEAADQGAAIEKLAIFEPPFIVDDSRPPVPEDTVHQLNRLLADGRRGDVVKRFMQIVGTPGIFIALMRFLPPWKKLTAVAHTVPYDLTIMAGSQQGRPFSTGRWARVTMPTLVLDGGKSPAWMRTGVHSAFRLLKDATYRTLPGQTHMVNAAVVAPQLVDFFTSGREQRATA